jgi:hypothetical protein
MVTREKGRRALPKIEMTLNPKQKRVLMGKW